MNIIGLGITVGGIGVLWLLIVFKDCLKRGYITDSEALISKVAIIFAICGLILLAIGWIEVMSI